MREKTMNDGIAEWRDWLSFIGSPEQTIMSYHDPLVRFVHDHRMGEKLVSDVDERTLDLYINPTSSAGVATRRLRQAGVKSFFKFCSKKLYCEWNPAELMKIRYKALTFEQQEPKVRGHYTEDEFNQLMDYLVDFVDNAKVYCELRRLPRARFWANASSLAFWTGLRFGDICTLEKASLQGDRLIVHTNKRNKRVALDLDLPYLGEGLIPDLLRKVPENSGIYFFPEEKVLYDRDPACKTWSTSFRNWAKYAGIEGKSFHCLRHAFVTRLREDGMSYDKIGELVGHSSEETTKGYAHS